MNELIFSLMVSILFLTVLMAAPGIAFSQTSPSKDGIVADPSSTKDLSAPQVHFPTQKKVNDYAKETGFEITQVNNVSQGEPNNIKAFTVANTTYIVWQGNIQNASRIFVSITRDGGLNYTFPAELTPPNSGNASNLQISVAGSYVAVVWQAYNQTTGISSIFGSMSRDAGHNFSSFRVSSGNSSATDPILPNAYIVIWKQKGGCGGGPAGTMYNQNVSPTVPIQSANTSSSVQNVKPPGQPGSICMHLWG
jgi:hypothetical protein